MPELPEVEIFRELSKRVIGRKIKSVFAPDAWYIKNSTPLELSNIFPGADFYEARRRGKNLYLDSEVATLGLHFGMSGRLVVDGEHALDQLMYSSNRRNPEWNRFGLEFQDGGSMSVEDPRRLGGVELNPDESRLGPDAMEITFAEFKNLVSHGSAPIKARIMDQEQIAGIGNLIADEVLWRSGIDPIRSVRSLKTAEVRKLFDTIETTIPELMINGGSHTGEFVPSRVEGGRCPRDGGVLVRRTIGGRTTWSCPKHQH